MKNVLQHNVRRRYDRMLKRLFPEKFKELDSPPSAKNQAGNEAGNQEAGNQEAGNQEAVLGENLGAALQEEPEAELDITFPSKRDRDGVNENDEEDDEEDDDDENINPLGLDEREFGIFKRPRGNTLC